MTKTEPFYSKELFSLKDSLFTGYGNINPFVFGQIFEILQYLDYIKTNPAEDIWALIHPMIISVSKNQFIDGYYAEWYIFLTLEFISLKAFSAASA